MPRFLSATNPNRPQARHWPRYSLRTFLALVALLAVGLGVVGHRHRQRTLAIEAHQAMVAKGVDARFSGESADHAIIFINANVTDDDLDRFRPAFNGYAPRGFGNITAIHLQGSKVSAEAMERFKRAAPNCEIIP